MNENPLSKYIGRSFDVVDKVEVKQGTSKDGAPYCYVQLHFINGYTKRLYPDDAERFAIISAFDFSQTSNQIDSAF